MPEKPEPRHGGLSGLKRLGTVIGNRRKSMLPSSSPERPDRTQRQSQFTSFRRGDSGRNIPQILGSQRDLTTISSREDDNTGFLSPVADPRPSTSRTDGQNQPPEDIDRIEPAPLTQSLGPSANGGTISQPTSSDLQGLQTLPAEPLQRTIQVCSSVPCRVHTIQAHIFPRS